MLDQRSVVMAGLVYVMVGSMYVTTIVHEVGFDITMLSALAASRLIRAG